MKRLAIVVIVGVTLLAVSLLFGTQATAPAGETKGNRSSGPVVFALATAEAVAADHAAVTPATAPGAGSLALGATPTVPSLGNAGIAVTVEPGQTVRTLTFEQWRAVSEAMPENPMLLARIGVCESHLNPAQVVIDTDGTPSVGAFGVKPQFHGAVPVGLFAQAVQAAGIIREHGTGPFPSSRGCADWNAQ